MVFSSIMFVYVFLPLVLIVYTLLHIIFHNSENKKTRHILNVFLLAASILFYAWGEPKNVLILIFCTVVNYLIGKFILRLERHAEKIMLGFGIAVNLGLLGYYKYAMMLFSGDTLSFINSIIPESMYIPDTLQIALPLGISFYIFQSISYLIDVYRKDIPPSNNFLDFACYLTMFPQLVAGPIVRYTQVAQDLYDRKITCDNFSYGITRFILGLAKKVIIADTLGKVADAAFRLPAGELPAYAAWAGIICYTFQIYYDFSGYSDMAIGMGRIFGFHFPENFNYPYIARNIQDFWRRWHISLSTWFRDYLYIPLGGNRKGNFRTYANLFIVFLLCGLWHGANWTFLAWGGYYGIFLVFERLFPNFIDKLPRFLSHIYTLLIVIFGWVLFKADSFSHALYYYKALLGFYSSEVGEKTVNLDWTGHDVEVVLVLATVFAMPIFSNLYNYFQHRKDSLPLGLCVFGKFFFYLSIMLLFVALFMPIFGASYKAFIYFRF